MVINIASYLRVPEPQPQRAARAADAVRLSRCSRSRATSSAARRPAPTSASATTPTAGCSCQLALTHDLRQVGRQRAGLAPALHAPKTPPSSRPSTSAATARAWNWRNSRSTRPASRMPSGGRVAVGGGEQGAQAARPSELKAPGELGLPKFTPTAAPPSARRAWRARGPVGLERGRRAGPWARPRRAAACDAT